MAVNTQTAAYLSHLGLLTLVDPTGGPKGPHSTVAYRLVPVSGWHNSQRFPYETYEDLKRQRFDVFSHEGVDYWLVPDDTTNTPGLIAHYAQRTGEADLKNPLPGDDGAYNRSLETFKHVGEYSEHTAAPEAVKRYVKDTDNFEEARRGKNELNERVLRQIGHGEGSRRTPPSGNKGKK